MLEELCVICQNLCLFCVQDLKTWFESTAHKTFLPVVQAGSSHLGPDRVCAVDDAEPPSQTLVCSSLFMKVTLRSTLRRNHISAVVELHLSCNGFLYFMFGGTNCWSDEKKWPRLSECYIPAEILGIVSRDDESHLKLIYYIVDTWVHWLWDVVSVVIVVVAAASEDL
jgi:hypothetical protein